MSHLSEYQSRPRKNALVLGGLSDDKPDGDSSEASLGEELGMVTEAEAQAAEAEAEAATPKAEEADADGRAAIAEEEDDEIRDMNEDGSDVRPTAEEAAAAAAAEAAEEQDRLLELEPMTHPRTSSTGNGITFKARHSSSLTVPSSPSSVGGTGTTTLRHSSSSSSMVRTKREVVNDPSVDMEQWRKKGSDAAQAVVSTLYCKILIVFGLAFPMAEVISDNVPKGYYQLFYVYLFLGSLLFLVYIYVELARVRTKVAMRRKKNIHGFMDRMRRLVTKTMRRDSADDDMEPGFEMDEERLIPRPRQIYGSFYIRMGAVLFGIGSMIYSGIEIGIFFEVGFHLEECKDIMVLIRPFLQMVFVFVQMYFIFLNHKMNIYRSKSISRFGLMHMIATNLCVWLNVLIMETHHEIVDFRKPHDDDGGGGGHHHGGHGSKNHTVVETVEILGVEVEHEEGAHSFSCLHSEVMGRLLAKSGPFLFPCTIEYSLISAAVLYMMWKNISEEHEHYKTRRRRHKISFRMHIPLQPNAEEMARNQYSVDCSNANNGLFSGIFVMVFTIISLIVFFVLIHSTNQKLHDAAITVASLTELTLYSLTTVAVIIGMVQIRTLWFDSAKKLELDNLLLVVAQTGVFIYSSFCIIGAFFQLRDHLTAFLSSLMTLVQTTIQTIFILDASSRFAYCAEQVKAKPGRQVVTFLLVCNLAMWAINTLETNRADSHPIQVKFYGGQWVWPIITHVSMPLAIFYRFHSTVCLCEIWTKTFKYKEYFVE